MCKYILIDNKFINLTRQNIMSFQKMFSSKSPFKSNHGNENARSFGGYDSETGEVIDARTGRTPSQQEALNRAYEEKIAAYPNEYAAYNEARDAYQQWNESENQFGFGDLDYPQQAELDSIESAWKNIKNQPVEAKPKIEVVKPATESVDPTKQ